MGNHLLKITSINNITYNVLRIVTNKPNGFNFKPGQAANIAINKSGWLKEVRPFTFTNLPANNSLEFTIKTYPEQESVTNELLKLKQDDELVLHDVFGAITYKGEGVFIAGGAGITPFISIFRNLKAKNELGNNMLLFANKTRADIILESELNDMLGEAFVNILSDEEVQNYHYGRVTEEFLKENVTDFNQQFYICGPPPMIKDVEMQLINLGVTQDHITKEIF
ncbi:flavodoxin reductase [Sediminibacterium sp.]|uniref:flavodoxin reductase n=1 Tax=Sediminibacterium sp. TaxID=1917865 RepID=UPI002733438F|nr:flavodoxin reductase [Sediminibacterium sp.]MDP3394993.1 flavodoxin reductase [Sediminibacterium sp.]MDP3565619.1 flavodoxin reductase [Sediminibacterium sp.]